MQSDSGASPSVGIPAIDLSAVGLKKTIILDFFKGRAELIGGLNRR